MNNKNTEEKSFNYNGLPCVFDNDKYYIFDPFHIRAATFSNPDQIRLKETNEKLKEAGFFRFFDSPQNKDIAERHITLILTTKCNLACDYCYVSAGLGGIDMSNDTAQMAIDNLTDGFDGRVFLQLFGGEPTLNMKALRVSVDTLRKNSKKYDPFLYITTNGVMDHSILNELIQMGFSFYLSIDGDRDFHDIHRKTAGGQGTYQRVTETLKKIIQSGAAVKVRATVTPETVDRMASFCEQMFSYGAPLIHFAHAVRVGQGAKLAGNEEDLLFSQKYASGLNASLDIAREKGGRILTPLSLVLGKQKRPHCKIIGDDEKIIITPDGKRTLCFGAQSSNQNIASNFICGDISKAAIMPSENQIVRKKIIDANTDNIKRECSKCVAQFLCEGGCPAENMTDFGHFYRLSERWCCVNRQIAISGIKNIIKRKRQ